MSVSGFDESHRPHSPASYMSNKKLHLKDSQDLSQKNSDENNLYSLNFEGVNLSLSTTNIRHPRCSESSTLFDTCSSSSSTSSSIASYDQKFQEIEFKPNIEATCSNDEQLDYEKFKNASEIDRNLPICNENGSTNIVNEQRDKSVEVTISKYKLTKPKKVNLTNSKVVPKVKEANLDEGIDLLPLLNGYYTTTYACLHPHCNAEMDLESEIDAHLKEKHNIDVSTNQVNFFKMKKFFYKCIFESKKCCRKLETLNKIANHICKIHLNKTTIQTQQQLQNLEAVTKPYQDISFNNIFMCSYNSCLWSFQFEKSLKMHKLKHKSIDNNSEHVEPEKNHICQKCNSRFARPSHLKSHMKTHIGFKCDYCVEIFPKHSNLLSHIFEKHKQTDKIYKCHYEGCTKSYLCKMYLSSHITKSHTKQQNTEQGKQCIECNLSFDTACLKRQHDEVSHDRKVEVAKTHKCTFKDCNKEFSTSSKLNRHSLTHVKIKKFSCKFEDCNAEFSRQDHLVNHLKFHDDQKIYECDYPNCFSTFKYQNNLITHKKSHITRNIPAHMRSKQESDIEHEPTYPSQRVSSKNIYQEFKPIIQDSDEETNKEYIDLVDINSDSQNDIGDESMFNQKACSNENTSEFKCQYCFFKLPDINDYNDHLKTHFDVNKANEKLNEYLIAEHQKDLNNQNLEDENLVEQATQGPSPFQHGFQHELERFNDVQLLDKTSPGSNDLIFDEIQSVVQLDNIVVNENNNFVDDIIVNEPKMKHNHVININSDDEDVVCSVVLENISGSARTDYKSNHMYIEKYKSKRKNPETMQALHKRKKHSENEENYNLKSVSQHSSVSPVAHSPSPALASSTTRKRKKTNSVRRKIQIKKHTNMQKSHSMTFQSNCSSLEESLIPQTSLQC